MEFYPDASIASIAGGFSLIAFLHLSASILGVLVLLMAFGKKAAAQNRKIKLSERLLVLLLGYILGNLFFILCCFLVFDFSFGLEYFKILFVRHFANHLVMFSFAFVLFGNNIYAFMTQIKEESESALDETKNKNTAVTAPLPTKDKFIELLMENKQIRETLDNFQIVFSHFSLVRHHNGNFTVNKDALCADIKNAKTQEIILFAAQQQTDDEFFEASEAPLLAALVRQDNGYILYDGLFLSVARKPRILEVVNVLDLAQTSGNVVYCPIIVNFTSKLTPLKAIAYLLTQANSGKVPLTEETRGRFFSLLSPSDTQDELLDQ